MAIPVLTYHSTNVLENTYAGNDHIALARDLASFAEWGVQVVTLDDVLAWHGGDDALMPDKPCVALTFDDGSDFDAVDIDHPGCGRLRSFLGILEDHLERTGVAVNATSFVIASPGARQQLDERSLVGKGWWNDDWWASAQASGRMTIGCHSWDHVHTVVDEVAQVDNQKGDFSRVRQFDDCDRQVRVAGDYIAEKLGGVRPRHFAFPYGQYSDEMVNHYLPTQQPEHGFAAAWSIEPHAVTRADCRWALPRFVCGRDWSSPLQLEALLRRYQR